MDDGSINWNALIIAVGVTAVVVIIIFFIVGRIVAGMKRDMAPLAQAMDGELKTVFLTAAYVNFVYKENECKAMIDVGGENAAPCLELRIRRANKFKLIVSDNEYRIEKLREKGLGDKLITGDHPFDQEFIAQSDDDLSARSILADDAKRNALKSLFRDGFNLYQQDQESVRVFKPQYDKRDLVPEGIREWLELTLKIVP